MEAHWVNGQSRGYGEGMRAWERQGSEGDQLYGDRWKLSFWW